MAVLTGSRPHKVVVVSMIGTAAVIVVANARRGQAPKPRAVLGLGFIFVVLSAMADFAPRLASPFALLVLAGTTLQEGTGALDGVLGAVQGSGPLGAADQGGADVQSAGVAGSAGRGAGGAASPEARKAVAIAKQQIGTPYVWGGEGPKGFDCSGLTEYAYKRAGVTIPRTAQQQHDAGFTAVGWGDLIAGDLVFGGTPSRVHHVVMYVGGGKVIAAPHSGVSVQLQPLSWHKSLFAGACRPAPGSRVGAGHNPK